MEVRMMPHKANDVLTWFVNHNQAYVEKDIADLITPLKAQKLLYYAQGAFLAIESKPLFDEKIENWDLGPVVPSVFQEYKSYKGNGIKEATGDVSSFSEHEVAMLTGIYDKYNRFSAYQLSKMTHNEDPWMITGQNEEITKDSIQKYFSTVVYKKWIDGTLFDDIPIVEPLYVNQDGIGVFPN
jgi:uncharacterized phage-associated protein